MPITVIRRHTKTAPQAFKQSLASMPPKPSTPQKPSTAKQLTAEQQAAKQAKAAAHLAEEQAAHMARNVGIQHTLDTLLERWPAVFACPPPGPLKVGIVQDLIAALPETRRTLVRAALTRWMAWHRGWYINAVIAGGARYDLELQPVGTVTEEQIAHAKVQQKSRQLA